MTIQAYPDDPRARLRAAERDIDFYVNLLAGDGLTDSDLATAAHYIRVAARARRLAREQIAQEGPQGHGDQRG